MITLHTDNAASLSVTSSNPAALAALGFGPTVTATTAAAAGQRLAIGLRDLAGQRHAGQHGVLVHRQSGAGLRARASSTARIDQSVTVQYGAQANESAIRSQLQTLAVFAAFTASPTGTNSAAQIAALSQRVTQI